MLPKTLDIETATVQEVRDYIADLEKKALSCSQIEIPVNHHFSKGVYAREIFVPKDSFIVGKIHKHENLNILIKGEMTILSIEGSARIKAPFTIVSPPGVKRVAFAHEDCIWMTIHGTDERDLGKIEEQFIAKSYEELSQPKEEKWLGQ